MHPEVLHDEHLVGFLSQSDVFKDYEVKESQVEVTLDDVFVRCLPSEDDDIALFHLELKLSGRRVLDLL